MATRSREFARRRAEAGAAGACARPYAADRPYAIAVQHSFGTPPTLPGCFPLSRGRPGADTPTSHRPCKFCCASVQNKHNGSPSAPLDRGCKPEVLFGKNVSSTMHSSRSDRTGSHICEILPLPQTARRCVTRAQPSDPTGAGLSAPRTDPAPAKSAPSSSRVASSSRAGPSSSRLLEPALPHATVTRPAWPSHPAGAGLSARTAPAPATSFPPSRPAASVEVSLPPNATPPPPPRPPPSPPFCPPPPPPSHSSRLPPPPLQPLRAELPQRACS